MLLAREVVPRLPLNRAARPLRLGTIDRLHCLRSPRESGIWRPARCNDPPVQRAAGDIASRFDVSHAAISQHLRVLKEAGLVSERREGRRRLYRARKESMQEIRSYLENFWDEAFERLRVEVEKEGGSRGPDRA